MIEAELDKRYCRRTVKAYDKIWKENDICIAQYHDNQKWYRAQIKKIIDSKNVQVIYNNIRCAHSKGMIDFVDLFVRIYLH